MTRPSDFLHVLDHPEAPALVVSDEAGELLLVMLAHMFFADEELHPGEVRVMERLVGDKRGAELKAYMKELATRKLDCKRLAELFTDPQDRDDVVTIAEHGIWGDNHIEMSEIDLLDEVAGALGIQTG